MNQPESETGQAARRGKLELSPAPESTDHLCLHERYQPFINGEFVEARDSRQFDSVNPATGQVITSLAWCGAEDVDRAVAAARKCHDQHWGPMPASGRAKYLFRIARLIQERARELAVLETLDGGKPIRESRDIDIPLAAAHFFYHAGWADKLDWAFPHRTTRALGVAGQVIPWNFPLLMAAWKIAPALATGNTVVLKPAETTSLTALKLAEIIQQADLPPGTVNIVTGQGDTGALLVAHPGIDKVAFTGSTEIGKQIRKSIAGSGKRCTLELGGKSANIVLDDAPVDQAVEGIVNGIYFNQGHVCCAGSRLFVQESVYEEVMDKLRQRMETLVVGDPLDKNTDIGAINSHAQLQSINRYIEIGRQDGGSCYQTACQVPEQGFWCPPTLFTDVAQSSRVFQEEIFGPVLAAQSFRTVSEVIRKANNTPYGLSAGVWSDKGSRIFNLSAGLQGGVVWANTCNRFDPASPFGGYRESGFGREGGLQGLRAYVDLLPVSGS